LQGHISSHEARSRRSWPSTPGHRGTSSKVDGLRSPSCWTARLPTAGSLEVMPKWPENPDDPSTPRDRALRGPATKVSGRKASWSLKRHDRHAGAGGPARHRTPICRDAAGCDEEENPRARRRSPTAPRRRGTRRPRAVETVAILRPTAPRYARAAGATRMVDDRSGKRVTTISSTDSWRKGIHKPSAANEIWETPGASRQTAG